MFVLSRDRLTYLAELVEWLETHGVENIHIVDSASTYEPLVEWLKETPHAVTRLSENLGPRAVWGLGLTPTSSPYAVTDCDVMPVPECPDDFLRVFADVLQREQLVHKVGFGLLTDAPVSAAFDDGTRQWEKSLWAIRRLREPVPTKAGLTRLYGSPIDTTFALYRAGTGFSYEAIRVGPPYVCQHRPWYVPPEAMTDEDRYYAEHADTASNWAMAVKEAPA